MVPPVEISAIRFMVDEHRKFQEIHGALEYESCAQLFYLCRGQTGEIFEIEKRELFGLNQPSMKRSCGAKHALSVQICRRTHSRNGRGVGRGATTLT